ncbi:hypothetical protein [Nocardioides campestrisoli]|uniref:hypothetical protein n=1 Tax=Nocardioides campestrisoli TaxID=2736757 RepID=UPI0015E6F168|nr:hypothetical protein [Nocardioides campestrisoli]
MRARRALAVPLLLAVTLCSLAACGNSDDSDIAQQRAEQLVQATQDNGSAPGLTTRTARSLYGEDADAVCGDLEDRPLGLAGWARVTRAVPEEHVEDLVAYDRTVVDVYCPDLMDDFDDLLDSLHVDESNR